MKLVWKMLFAVTLVQLAFAAVALAQAAGLPTDAQAADLGTSLWNFFVTKNYAAMAGPGLTLFVWALKKYDQPLFTAIKLPQVGAAIDKFLNQPFVSFLLPTVVAGLGGGITALATGHSFVEALGAIWATSSAAIVTYIGLKKAGEQADAGNAAAAATDTKAEAVAALAKAAADEAAKKPPAP